MMSSYGASFDRMETELWRRRKDGQKAKHKAKINNEFMSSSLLTV